MTLSFRHIEDTNPLSSADGLAGDEALVSGLADGNSPPTLRLYRYHPSAIVGRYQNLTDAINLDTCRRYGVSWNRRHTGGGTVLMGPEQVAIALALPDGRDSERRTIKQHFEFFAAILADALGAFGIEAAFVGKNDLQVDGRKIAGLAISQDTDGAVFYHGSLLLDFDVGLMVQVLNLPTEHLEDRGQSCFSRRMTTVREHVPGASFPDLTAAIARSLESLTHVQLCRSSFLDHEHEAIARLKRERYENEEWICSSRVMRRWRGMVERKTAAGTIRIYVDGSGPALDAVLITGDYFSRNLELATLESNLKGTPARSDAIASVISKCGQGTIYRLTAEELAELIVMARQSNTTARLTSQA